MTKIQKPKQQVPIEEALKLVSFELKDDKWIISEIHDDIHGDIHGEIRGHIYGSVHGHVLNDVNGLVCGTVCGSRWVSTSIKPLSS